MNEKISIIVPVYNVEKYLARCIESLLKQTYVNVEIILVDDGSTDSSGEICDRFAQIDKRIIPIHVQNNGLGSARNIGMNAATGDYITFVDSDDCIHFKMIDYLRQLIDQYNADIAIADYSKFENDYPLYDSQQKEQIELLGMDELLQKFFRVKEDKLIFSAWGKLFKNDLLSNIYFLEHIINEDVEFSYRVFSKTDRAVISNLTMYYWYNGNTSITRNLLKKRDFDLLKMWDLVLENTKLNNPKYTKYANINRLRAEFTLLCKGALYGIDKSVEDTDIINDMLMNIRKNIFSFLKYKGMSLNRKIILVIMYIDYRLLRFILDKYRMWKK